MRHQAAFTLALSLQDGAPGLPDGHLERINALQARRGKPALGADAVLVRPVRLFGNKLTSYFTRVADADLRTLADQINASGGPVLSAHVTDNTPMGSFYAATVTPDAGGAAPDLGQPATPLWLDTWFYVLNDAEGQRLMALIDGGVINEASIGYFYDQALCSITGADYWDSPYWRGNVYTLTDPETGVQSEKLCFVWTTGNVEFAEGSLVYRGAYPGTQVGGEGRPLVAAAQGTPSALPTPTRFQLAASRDMAATFEKAPAKSGAGTPPPPPPPADEGEPMKLRLKLPDGSVHEIDAAGDHAQTLLDGQITAALERGAQTQREAHAAALGLDPKDADAPALQRLAREAGDGRTYRADLLAELTRLTLAQLGNAEAGRAAAERAGRAFGTLDLADIRDEVARLQAAVNADLPNGRQSEDPPEVSTQTAARKPNLDAV